MTQHNQDQQQEPQEGRAVIYQRPGRSQAAPETLPQQATNLMMFAREHGFTDVTLFADGYKPGSATLIEREMLAALLRAITNPDPDTAPIRAVFTSEERLFRNAGSANLTALIEIFRRYGILLITPLGEYDFRNPIHAQLFHYKVQDSYQFVAQMVTARLQAGKRAARKKRLQAPSTQATDTTEVSNTVRNYPRDKKDPR